MTKHFHRTLNYMAIFTAVIVAGVIIFHHQFMQIATSNIYLNGIIIGTGLFGIILCFAEMFKLLPEYKWLYNYIHGIQQNTLPPRLLRPMASVLYTNKNKINIQTMTNIMDAIMLRLEDSRESIKYITNTLIFLGLLGTFWGLILTVGGFAELINGLSFDDADILTALQSGLGRPLSGMTTAFTSSLLGLGFSLTVGFLALQVQLAQNTIFREIEDYLSEHTKISDTESITRILPQINFNTRELTKTVANIEQNISK
ncbi:MAG: hypothetical protein ACLRFI_01810 [Alphaproteobacteria bacterium]